MIAKYVDVNDSPVILKLIDGTEVYGISLDPRGVEKDFEVKVTENSVCVYEPIILSTVNARTVKEDGTEETLVLYMPARYIQMDICPFVEFSSDKFLSIHNMEESMENYYHTCVEYIEAQGEMFEIQLNNSQKFLEDQTSKLNEKSNLEILEDFDETEATVN